MTTSDLWHIHGLPVHLLMWVLGEPYCLGQSREGVVTICYAMHPDQTEWRLAAVPPVPYHGAMHSLLACKTYVFAVNHEDHTLRFRCVLEGNQA